ncbi:MAG: WD40 repeat domain-containing protein, partial [Roseiflexaceae bacterium]
DAQAQAAQVALSPDGQTYATALADGTIQLWPASGGKPLRTLCLPRDGAPNVVGLSFLDTGKTLAAASAGGHLLFWQVSDGALVRQIDVDEQAVVDVAFAPDGRTFAASVDQGMAVQLFNIESAKPLRTSIWNTIGAVSLIFSPDSQMLAISEAVGNVRRIQINGNQELAKFPLPSGDPPSLAFAPDSQTLAVGLADGTVQIWQMHGAVGRTLASQTDLPVYPAFAPDGQTLAVARMDGKIDLWDVGGGTLLRTLDGGPTKGHANLTFSPGGQTLVAAWEAGTIELWGLPL